MRHRRDPVSALSARERQVLALVAQGHSNTAIARHLVVSEPAVGEHIGNIFAKLHLPQAEDTDRRVLAVLAYLGSGNGDLSGWPWERDPVFVRVSVVAEPIASARTGLADTGSTPVVRAIAASADAEFEAFYRATVDRVYRALAVTLADPHLAREATDEAMARAYAHWHRVAACNNPGAWVFRVALNWATSWWRKIRRERPFPDDAPVRTGGAGTQDEPGVIATAALGRLPLAQRSVVVCRVLLDMTTVETALALDIAEGTVKSRLARGLAALRAALREEEEPR